jgi:hypothetical protein
MSQEKINPFKELERSLKEAPPHLRKKVMGDVATAKLLMDIGSFYAKNCTSTLEGMLKTKNRIN